MRRRTLAALLVAVALAAACALGAIAFIREMPGKSFEGPLPPLTDDERAIAQAAARDLQVLAGDIGERNTRNLAALDRASAYVRKRLVELGYVVSSQPYRATGITGDVLVSNLEAKLTGTSKPDEWVVVGAHYDSTPGTPGADDNASGVAALLALAERLVNAPHPRTLVLVAYVNEEMPYSFADQMGSMRHAERLRAEGRNVVAMLALETMGYYSDAPGSQNYPPGVGALFPDRGDFLAFVGNFGSRGLVRKVTGAFRGAARLPSQGAALPAWVPGVGWSDHQSYWRSGYPAIMVTDTALFRNPHYHHESDLPATVNVERLARAVTGLRAAIEDLLQ